MTAALWVRAAMVMSLVAGCGASSSGSSGSSGSPPPAKYESDQSLKRRCEASDASGCKTLADRLITRATLGTETEKNQRRATTYLTKACALSPVECARLAQRYLDGQGVEKSQEQAIEYFRLSCAEERRVGRFHSMAPPSCRDLGEQLLEMDFLGNYEEAAVAFEHVCETRQVCEGRDLLRGTGRLTEGSFPEGAFGYRFGMRKKEVGAVCARQRGKLRRSDPDLACDGPELDFIDGDKHYVSLDFCGGDVVCSISFGMKLPADGFFERYWKKRMEMERLYGAPTKISTMLKPECRAEAAAAACLEARDTELLSMWFWGERGVVGVRLTAHKGQIGLLMDYKDEQKLKQ